MQHPSLPLVAALVLAAPAPAQETCGLPGVDVTVSPAFASPGEPIEVTLTNSRDSGTRVLLDYELEREGISSSDVSK